MKQARNTKEKSADSLERGKREEHQPDEFRWQHSLIHLQRLAGNRAVLQLMESGAQLQTKLRISDPVDEHEYEADGAGEQALRLRQAPSGRVQRKCADCSPGAKCAACEEEEGKVQRKPNNGSDLSYSTPQIQLAPRNGDTAGAATPDTASETAAEPATSTAGPLIVEDDAAMVAPGQMRKSEFLEQLRSSVCTTADEALKEAGQSTEGCPYIEKWLSYYADQEPAHIERALRKYALEAATATSARDYIPAVSNRVRRAVVTWAKTGELTGVPDELQGMLTGPGAALGAIGGMLGSIGSAIGGAVTAAAGAIGGAFSSIGKALFKRKEGAAKASDDPQEIQSQLSSGQPLDAGAKSRMGAAFGEDFSDVRVHTDGSAEGLSDQLNARAFTVGSDIAFGRGEYRPGTMIGDALIAHELAHVVQQSGGSAGGPMHKDPDASGDVLEQEADVAAAGAVSSLWLGAQGMIADVGKRALPRLRAGLKLQRCKSYEPKIQFTKGEDADRNKALAARRKVADAITITGGTADEKDKEVVLQEMIRVPLEGLLALKNKGVNVVVCRNSVTEIREDLKGKKPRHWPEGKTWDTVPGLQDPNQKRVIIATRDGRVPKTGEGHGAHNLVVHEVGHAVGDAVAAGGVTDPKFIAARDQDKARLDDYEGQPGVAGVEETYAESFARFYGDDPKDAVTYPNLHAYWASEPLLAEKK